ncbi:MAG: SGNH/GDSL hydrolase family protein [Saprospiraceae bacterium]
MPFKLSLLALPLMACLLFSFKTAKKHTRVVFFGDSITEAAVYPGGYIVQLRDSLLAQGQAKRYQLMGAGISGNKVYDLYLRVEDDVLARKPDVVVIYVGVNDVWHKHTHHTGTDADKFQKFYAALIQKFKKKGIRVVICTPACIGERYDGTNPLDYELDAYAQIIRNLAQEKNVALCDFRKAFRDYSANNNPDNLESGILTSDGVHLNERGNKLVAEMLLQEVRSSK